MVGNIQQDRALVRILCTVDMLYIDILFITKLVEVCPLNV